MDEFDKRMELRLEIERLRGVLFLYADPQFRDFGKRAREILGAHLFELEKENE